MGFSSSLPRPVAALYPSVLLSVVLGYWVSLTPAMENYLRKNVQPILQDTSVWRSSGTFLQRQWEWVYESFRDEYQLATVGTFLVIMVCLLVMSSLYTFMDLTGRPAVLVRYKIQANVNPPPVDPAQFAKVGLQMIPNTLLTLAIIYLLQPLMVWRGMEFGRELPSVWRLLLDFPVCVLMQEMGFYYGHRLVHVPYLYKRIHKRHHEFKAPMSVVAPYSHPIEHVTSNVIPLFTGPILAGCHVVTMWLWLAYLMYETTTDHSGYHMPFARSPEFHDYHHAKFNYNYGTTGLLDWLHGTDSAFRQSTAWKRHRILFGTTPLSESIPDTKTK
ncbi:fatty acid hydroxylase domain-containing protein 2-like [Branchiostoma lanceolatum]|uniref:fatty acid hydroxylase domain-containing protein 2-like n=1 Tax=Branchiostoma lanceolatum TaxID=7740 RepID=UPI003456F8A2